MRAFKLAAFALVLSVSSIVAPVAFAGDTDPLFVNATTDDGFRSQMALKFSKNQQERKHPVTVFLNDKGVLIATKANAEKFKDQQEIIAALIAAGGTVVICPVCMKRYGVNEADLLPGIKIGSPETTGAALFSENTKTLTW
jgi:sulfur relay (sulfurtransferase) complex TusBCD TusD component (DsrE family)